MAKKTVTRVDPQTGRTYTTVEGQDEDVLIKDKVTDVSGLAEAARKAKEEKKAARPTPEPEDDPNDMSLAAVARRKKKKQLSTESQLKALAK